MKTGKDFRRIIRQHYFQSQKGISNTSEMKKNRQRRMYLNFIQNKRKMCINMHKNGGKNASMFK